MIDIRKLVVVMEAEVARTAFWEVKICFYGRLKVLI